MLISGLVSHKKFQQIGEQISYLPRTLRLVWSAAPKLTLVWGTLLIIQGVLPAANVYLTKLVVDSLATVVKSGAGNSDLRPTMWLISGIVAIIVLTEVLRSASDWAGTAQSEFIQDHILAHLHEKSVAVDLAFYESPEYYDRLDQARTEAPTRSLALLQNMGNLGQNGITLLAMSVVLIRYSVWLPVLLFVSTLPALYVVLQFDRRFHTWWKNATPARRLIQYYDIILTNSAPAAEVRLFGLGPHFHTAYQTLRQRLRSERLQLMRNQSVARMAAAAIALLFSGASIAWMVWRAVQGMVTLGDLALFYQAFNRGQDLMRSLLGNVGQIYSNSLFLGNLFAFLELKPRVVEPEHAVPMPRAIRQNIAFRDVTFRYPGSERAALQNFNLTMPAGKIVAVVGVNGAGKTTLVKLLCRFYDPDSGSIELDGINIREISLVELRQHITVLFQFPMPYQDTAIRNIALGDVRRMASAEEIEMAARMAGVHEMISRLPQGYETQLGKWFGEGVELSGGEWQRVAMARAYLRQAPILVLDEPTSAMDSWAEADWFERLRDLAKERTGLIITHRFTIAMRADIIHVMDQGQIVESGSHDELLALNGRYAASWMVQMQASHSGAEALN